MSGYTIQAMMRLAGGHGDLDSLADEVGQQLRAALSAVPDSPRAGTAP